MNHIELDSYDWRLLKALQTNARLTNVALSEQINLSPSQCSRRLQRLEQSNLIEAYFTQLNASELGYQVTAFVSITLDKSSKNSDIQFQQAIIDIPKILECYSVSGEADYWLRVISENLPSLSTFLNESLAKLPCVRDLTSTVVLNRIKHAPSIPLPN
ncbi:MULTISPECIES: Lrp/AsnC family transcriptional regulator [Marinomonas]|uniref:Lrp/AsnC family transcriptional regulator n=1 Tax=Marinomonas arctica TaxID=383750 RepID=A0A7H1J8N1_9GAMM|nr:MULTISPECIES: Lrp/AsnC family transcriptional regulator [Marinomonas]MCS7487257.1 AsnC family transcriptional regulator [Marinomonas sp. BSi20414]QNT06847.1 Lrp/AsnC family transcriptional regulator [Marinomonas arctica]GGN33670.1 AsnC family transcriptional regulator [Marinomonas arctica]